MTIHKRARLTPIQPQEIFNKYFNKGLRICDLERQYSVTRQTIYRVLERGRDKDFTIHKSINKRYRCLEYGLKRLAKVEAELEKKLKAQAKKIQQAVSRRDVPFRQYPLTPT